MSDRLSDEQARRLWQRAAELQAEAARTLEERSAGLARRDAEDETTTGYSLDHVRQAAVEAGISPEFVDRAIQESAALEDEDEPGALSRRVLGEVPKALIARRVYDFSAEVIFASMQRVMPRLRLSLIDTTGGAPLEGGWLHFDLPTVGLQDSERLMVDLYHWADVRQLQTRLVAVDESRCELTVRAPLGFSRRLGTWVVTGLSPVPGLIAALVTGAVVSGVVAAPLAVWGAAAGAFGLGTFGGLRGMRKLTRVGWRRGEAALDRLLGLIGMDARTGGAFQPAPPPVGGASLQGFLES